MPAQKRRLAAVPDAPPTAPEAPATPTFDADVLRLVDIQALSKELDAEAEQIRERLRAHGSGTVGALRVHVTPQRRFSAQLAVETLTPEQIAQIAETSLSSTKAKQLLPPAVYDSLLYEFGKPRVSVS